jgi:radical SAM protein with 4Fe4S-binding SPASM domain
MISDISRHQNQPTMLIFSGGEPLLREDIFDLANHAKKSSLPIAIASNGTIIDLAAAKKIAQTGFGRCAVSLDAPRAEIHDRCRNQPGSFESAVSGIRRVIDEKISVQINTTVSRSNLALLPEMKDFVESLGVAAWHVFVLVPVGCGAKLSETEMLTPEEEEKTLQWLFEISQTSSLQIKPTCAPQYYRILAQNNAAQNETLYHRFTKGCLAGINVCFVSSSGEVFPCGYFPKSAGNIRTQSLRTIWNESPLFHSLRDESLLKGRCGGCEFSSICGGCRARAYGVTGDYLVEDPGCRFVS